MTTTSAWGKLQKRNPGQLRYEKRKNEKMKSAQLSIVCGANKRIDDSETQKRCNGWWQWNMLHLWSETW